ncbi:MAG: zinc ribbon domain-containing protein [Anaerolineae bacterium]
MTGPGAAPRPAPPPTETCPNCGQGVQANWQVCPYCGENLTAGRSER